MLDICTRDVFGGCSTFLLSIDSMLRGGLLGFGCFAGYISFPLASNRCCSGSHVDVSSVLGE